ncbi:alkylhydroperoxide reductase [Haloferula helveola]|uniref:Alkylhydroperoxide reductase n=1 Tax=Haloferula helveola TaxID=490095 RepID=A0ABN6H904_9BACT|nr:alkylhydroperoxide reductase [Haloferula helveola]
MPRVLIAAGVFHLLFGVWANFWPNLYFDWIGCDRPNHPMLWRGVGLLSAAFGCGFLIASRSPVRHWPLVLMGFLKFNFVIISFITIRIDGPLPYQILGLVVIDDLLWWFPFAAMLWAAAEAHAGRPPSGDPPLTLEEAGQQYHLSTGVTLGAAAKDQVLVLVFLRHFGCTFTRKILRELEDLKREADRHGARLVLVHMLSPGGEKQYLDGKGNIARIADPMCELYRAFDLGKGGFLELFGPRVWLPLIIALFRGCGIGHVAGDGLQLPGAFLFHDNDILAAQRAKTQADLPDLPALFEGLPEPENTESVPA